MTHVDVAIVGNGILAYTLAHTLHQKNPRLRIALIGPEDRLYSATSAAGAMLGCFGEVTEMTFSDDYHRRKFDLGYQAKQRWPAWLQDLNAELAAGERVRVQAGTFIIQNTHSGNLEDRNFAAIEQALEDHQEPYEKVRAQDIPGYAPITSHRSLRSLFLPHEGFISPSEVLAALHKVLSRSPCFKYWDANVEEILVDEGVKALRLSTGDVMYAEQVVLAAGAATQALLDQVPEVVERMPKVFAGVGYALSIPKGESQIQHVIRTPNRSFSCGLHVLPNTTNSLYVGATNWVSDGVGSAPKMGALHFLLECGINQIDQQFNDAEILKFHVGNRPVSLDTFPLLGETSLLGLWVMTGTYRDGFFHAPILAEEMANQILYKAVTLEEFQPERLPLITFSKTQAVDATCEHYLSLGYESDMTLPKVGWDSLFEDLLRERITRIYDQLDMDDFVLPPDFFLYIDRDGTRIQTLNETYRKLKAAHAGRKVTI